MLQCYELSPPSNVVRVRRHTWVELVGFLLCGGFSVDTPVFPSSQKANI